MAAVFRIPKQVNLEDDREIDEAVKTYNDGESEKVDQKIKEVEMRIKQVNNVYF